MHIKSFEWFVNREKGNPCLVAGTAPTIENFPYKKFKGIYVTCGDGVIRMKDLFVADYWVNANGVFPIPEEHLEIINRFKQTVFVFSDSAAYSARPINPKFLEEKLIVKWFAFDQRHFNNRPCPDKKRECCKLLDLYPKRETLQEYIQKKYHLPLHYSSGGSGALHALAFAILMGCSPIYIQGIEIPLVKKDYNYWPNDEADALLAQLGGGANDQINFRIFVREVIRTINNPTVWGRVIRKAAKKTLFPNIKLTQADVKSPFYDVTSGVLKDFSYLVDLAHANGIEVYNLSKTSSLNIIKSLAYKDPDSIKK